MSTIPAPGPLYQRRQRGTRGRRAFAVPVTQQEILLHGQRVAFLEAGADYGGPVVMFHDLLPGSRLEIFRSGALPHAERPRR